MAKTILQLIDGDWVESRSRELIEVTDPATQHVLALALFAGRNPLPEVAEAAPYPLASLYAPDLEALARDTYARDYVGYGFGDWAA